MIRLQYMILNNLKDEEIAFHFHSSYEITYSRIVIFMIGYVLVHFLLWNI